MRLFVKAYEIALEKANQEAKLQKGLSPLEKQILRDILFGRFSNDGDAIKYKPEYSITELTKTLYYFFNISNKTIFVSRKNLVTSLYLDHDKNCVKFHSLLNPIALWALFFSISYRLKNKFISKTDPERYLINSKIYVAQKVAKLLKKRNTQIIYFSCGVPQYLRFVSDQAKEIQHGIVHKYHPIANPITEQDGKFLIIKKYWNCNFPLELNFQFLDVSSRINSKKNIINKTCFFEGNPDHSKEILKFFEDSQIHIDKVFHHPNSPNILKKKETVENKFQAINYYQTVYSGLSTILIDLSGEDRGILILTSRDVKKLGVEPNEDSIKRKILEHYGCQISNIKII